MKINNILTTGKLHKELENIIATEKYPQTFRFLGEDQVGEQDLQWADAYVGFKPVANFDFHQVKWVHSLGAGVDGFLSDLEWKKDVLLTRTICSFGERISQYCLSYYLSDLQEHEAFASQQQKKQWHPITPKLIHNQRVLVYGTGEIGQEIAKLFSMLGLEVFGVSSSGKDKDYFNKVYSINEETEVLQDVDVIINTLPLTPKTTNFLNSAIFEQLNQAMFINVGRGGSVVTSDLIDALHRNYVRIAILDVFEQEPIPHDSKLWDHAKVRITPHVSAVTTAEEAADCLLDTLDKLTNNQPLTNVVDVDRGY